MIFYLFLSVTLPILAYLAYRSYQNRVAGLSRVRTSYRRAAKVHFYSNASNAGNRSSNELNLSLNGTLSNTSHDSSRIVASSFDASNSSFGLRNRNTSSRVSFISPNSIYGYMPKTGIKSEKSRELTREFKVKLSPFPQSRILVNNSLNVTQELGNGLTPVEISTGTVVNKPLVASSVNCTISPLNRDTPTQASNFVGNRSNKRPISLNDSDEQSDNDVLSKKSKNLLDNVICENDEMQLNFSSNNVTKKAQKRNATESENQVGVKRIKNNEILSSYSSNLAYHNFNKRKFSPDFATSIEKKKRTVIEELELLTSDQTSPYYRKVYCSTDNVAHKIPSDSRETSELDFEMTQHDSISNDKVITLDDDSDKQENIEVNDVVSVTEDAFQEVESEKDERLYPMPTHVHSIKDHEYDRKKTKNRLNRFIAAVQEANKESEEPISEAQTSNLPTLEILNQPVRFPVTTTVTSTVTPITSSIVLASEDKSRSKPVESTITNFTITLPRTISQSVVSSPPTSVASLSSGLNFDFSPSSGANTASTSNLTTSTTSGTSNAPFTLPKLTLNLPSSQSVNTDASAVPKVTFVSASQDKPLISSISTLNSVTPVALNSSAENKNSITSSQTVTTSSGFVFNLGKTTSTSVSNVNKPTMTFGQSTGTSTAATSGLAFNFASSSAASIPSITGKVAFGQIPSTTFDTSSKSSFNFGLASTTTDKSKLDQVTSAPTSLNNLMFNISKPISTNSSATNNPSELFNFSAVNTTKSEVTSSDKPTLFSFGQITNSTAPSATSNIFGQSSLSSTSNANIVPVFSSSQSSVVTPVLNFGQSSSTQTSTTTNPPSLFTFGQSTSNTSSTATNPVGIFSFGSNNNPSAIVSTSSQPITQSSLFSFGSNPNAGTISSSMSNNNITAQASNSFTSSVFNFGQTTPAQQSSVFKSPEASMTSSNTSSGFTFNPSSSNMFSFAPKSNESSGSSFKPAPITFDFKVKPTNTQVSSNQGFNFNAASLSSPGSFNFASPPSNSTSSNPTPFNFSGASSNFSFGASNSSSLFQFNSK